MATVQHSRVSSKPVKTVRKVRVIRRPCDTEESAMVVLTVNGVETSYVCVEQFPSDGDRFFRLTKADGTVYDVCLDDFDSTCDCKGFRRHGRCKHVDGLQALVNAKRL